MNEHEMVRLKETYLNIPAGTTGTIIYVYQCKSAFEVEFKVGNTSKVVTIDNISILESAP